MAFLSHFRFSLQLTLLRLGLMAILIVSIGASAKADFGASLGTSQQIEQLDPLDLDNALDWTYHLLQTNRAKISVSSAVALESNKASMRATFASSIGQLKTLSNFDEKKLFEEKLSAEIRLTLAGLVLERNLVPAESQVLLQAHEIGEIPYSKADLRKKYEILRTAFDGGVARDYIRLGLAGTHTKDFEVGESPSEATRIIKGIERGDISTPPGVSVEGRGGVFIGRSPLGPMGPTVRSKLEVIGVNPKTGRTVVRETFTSEGRFGGTAGNIHRYATDPQKVYNNARSRILGPTPIVAHPPSRPVSNPPAVRPAPRTNPNPRVSTPPRSVPVPRVQPAPRNNPPPRATPVPRGTSPAAPPPRSSGGSSRSGTGTVGGRSGGSSAGGSRSGGSSGSGGRSGGGSHGGGGRGGSGGHGGGGRGGGR